MEAYYWMLGIAAIISALAQRRSNTTLAEAIEELKTSLRDHGSRIEALEKKVQP